MRAEHELLEDEFGRWAGADNVVACASGTAALHLSLEVLRLPPGSSVLVPDYCMVAVPRACTLAGLVPVPVDVLAGGPHALTLDPARADAACARWASDPYLSAERPVRALVAVATYGRPCHPNLWDVAAKYGLVVVEDLAEAHGLPPHPGSAAACWSFYRNKVVFGEEGGAVAFADPAHAALASQLRCLGFTDAHDYRHVPRGHNYRMSGLHAAEVRKNLGRVKHWQRFRAEEVAVWDAAVPAAWRMPPRAVNWVYDLRVPGWTREAMTRCVRELRAAGVEARHGFYPVSLQPEYSGTPAADAGVVADLAASEVMYLNLAQSQPGELTAARAAAAVDVIRRHAPG